MEGPRALFQGPKFLDALVDDLSEKLKSFLGEKVVSVFGVRDEFNKLQDKMKYIKSMLTDAKRRKMDDSVTRTWIDELIDVMHDAEDIIDDFRSQLEKQSEDGASSWSVNQVASKLNPRTWDKTVASGVGAIYVHEVEKLSSRSCWELLCKKAYIEEEDDMLNLRDVGMGIVKKCDGLPLAIKVLPQGITQLNNLRCLSLRDTPLISVPRGISRLKFLNELKGFIVAGEQCSGDMQSGWQLDELENLTQLRCLWLDKLENAAIQSSALAGKCYLKTLQLACTLPVGGSGHLPGEDDCRNIEETFDKLEPPQCLEYLFLLRFFGRRFPSWLENLSYLTYLILENCISCLYLPPLGQLQHLKCLRIIGARSIVSIGPEFMGTVISGRSNLRPCFPKLEFLRIEEMPNWEKWSFIDQVPEKFFPSLLKIDIVYCPKLKALPDQLKHISSLEELYLSGLQEIRKIENLTAHFESIRIRNSSCEKLSNIPAVQHLSLVGCSALRCVENLDALQSLYLEDETVEHLPEWLPGLINQHHSNNDMKLDFLCNMTVLQRCLLGGQDWPIIEQFSHIRAFTKDNAAFIEYQKQPYSYHTNL
ncbi:hypothetical protein LUZ63_001840 [Rhynchospora breviuscula]|uniref:Rx N-terminal domain-containing protein n=1 Tax=Rhynchospora breviuscula TaxID=2022672 RepID=A0A9Q0CXP8_9POAL|nr:hypothetical protein LUZ63_001840 [Rhynchospora breviuscula]